VGSHRKMAITLRSPGAGEGQWVLMGRGRRRISSLWLGLSELTMLYQ
jgi:microcompartment protein CcmK/EutM